MYSYIAIEGNIGAGKTTLAIRLAQRLNARLLTEQFADNPFLPAFYSNPASNALPLELWFLADRYEQQKESSSSVGAVTVADYLFFKSQLFARVNLKGAELALFTRVFDMLYPQITQPDVLIYLAAPVATLQAHIKVRGRSYELAIADSYLEELNEMYEEYLKTLTFPVLKIDTSRFDFEKNEYHLNTLLGLLSGGLERGIHEL